MDYLTFLRNGADVSEIQAHLTSGAQTSITIRLPKNLHAAAKSAAALKGISFSSYVREQLIELLANPNFR